MKERFYALYTCSHTPNSYNERCLPPWTTLLAASPLKSLTVRREATLPPALLPTFSPSSLAEVKRREIKGRRLVIREMGSNRRWGRWDTEECCLIEWRRNPRRCFPNPALLWLAGQGRWLVSITQDDYYSGWVAFLHTDPWVAKRAMAPVHLFDSGAG